MRKGKLFIPIEKVNEGVELCLKNSHLYIKEAKLLLKKSSPHAVGLLVLATEEAGKAKMLLRKRDIAIERKIKYVNFEPKDGFYNHEVKLNSVSLDVMQDEVFAWLKREKWHPAAGYAVSLIDLGTKWRESTFYVDFDNQRKEWTLVEKYDKEKLCHVIEDLKRTVKTLEAQIEEPRGKKWLIKNKLQTLIKRLGRKIRI